MSSTRADRDRDGRHRALLERALVIENERLSTGVGLLTLEAPRIAPLVEPGQFVHVRIDAGADFILRRPFSVHRTAGGTLQILFQVLGRGTLRLAEKVRGDSLDLLGPLGHGFDVPEDAAHALVVAGGLGAAPMGGLVETLSERGISATVAIGAPTVERLLVREAFETFARRVLVATEDGSAGEPGLVTSISRRMLEEGGLDVVFVCGPEAMSRAVALQCSEHGVPCQVSLERLMACGIGACLSCVVTTSAGLKRACCDGPVFDALEVIWDASETPPRH